MRLQFLISCHVVVNDNVTAVISCHVVVNDNVTADTMVCQSYQ